ncbi:MAG: hypothetical protein RLZZ200_2753 [Pseudomonadota bacterium]
MPLGVIPPSRAAPYLRVMKPVAVITGTTQGIGRVVARRLAEAGLHVVMLCRDRVAARRLCEQWCAQDARLSFDAVHCDLSSLSSVRNAAAAVLGDHAHLQLLVNNAGTISMKHRRSADGFELCFAVNHLGPFLLTELLRDRITAGGRIVNTASRVHAKARKFDVEAFIDPGAPYRAGAAYAQSKLANVLHTLALVRRLEGSGITANCLHPGVVATSLLPRWLRSLKSLWDPVILDATQGASTTLKLSLAPGLDGVTGRYFDEYGLPQEPSSLARNIDLQERLWNQSRSWCGLPT